MKKTLIFVSIFLFAFLFTSCNNSNLITTQSTAEGTAETTTNSQTTTGDVVYDRYQEINLYSINDFHGGTYSDIANLGNWLFLES